MSDDLFRYVLRLADDHLILGQRLGEWCGKAPSLEEDLALANIGLDCLGQARALYAYAGKIEGKGRDEDDLAFLRPEREYCNALLVEQPNRDFAWAIARQFYFSAYMLPFWRAMAKSTDDDLRAIAAKAEKEVAYHLRHSAEWVIRLGDGTEESRRRMIEALEELFIYTGELFEMDAVAHAMVSEGVGVDASALRDEWRRTVDGVLAEAHLTAPEAAYDQSGGREGRHTEHLGHLLSELQYMQRAYPGLEW
ncbi:MAG: phenylacetic acid degradation protein [Rhizobiaceae bacterium MnEN-MB40S]|nr:MAG: phenylacetic acid degradation protein [Rhizobiaceae bacterium MnEN-MB40S]